MEERERERERARERDWEREREKEGERGTIGTNSWRHNFPKYNNNNGITNITIVTAQHILCYLWFFYRCGSLEAYMAARRDGQHGYGDLNCQLCKNTKVHQS